MLGTPISMKKKNIFNDLILPPPIQLIVRRPRWSLIISLSHPPFPTLLTVSQSAPNWFCYQSNSISPLRVADVLVLRRGCLTMRCRNRRTKGRRGPQTRSCGVWWRRMTSLFQDKVAAIGVMRHWLTLLVFCIWLYIHLHVSPSVSRHAGWSVVVRVFHDTLPTSLLEFSSIQKAS